MLKVSKLGLVLSSVYAVLVIGSFILAKYFCSGWFCGLYLATALLPWSEMGFGTGVSALALMFVLNLVIVYLAGAILMFVIRKINQGKKYE